VNTPSAPALSSAIEHQELVFEAAAETLASVCGLEIDDTGDSPPALPDTPVIVGVISLVGGIDWSLYLGLPQDTALAVAAKFAGFEIPFDSPALGDTIGALANIFAGLTKAKLEALGLAANISWPNVMRGRRTEALNCQHVASARREFASRCGPLWVEVGASTSRGK
jgi:CheY-specific phosphatase CheX